MRRSRRPWTANRKDRSRAPLCRRCGIGCISCRCTANPKSARTATPGAAGSCPRWRCPGACGPAASCSSTGRRIHYDRRYVTQVEGYPGLIVHGPLIATLLVDLLRWRLPEARVAKFEFRALRPIFDTRPFFVCGEPQPDGRTFRLWARDHEGWLAMDATALAETTPP